PDSCAEREQPPGAEHARERPRHGIERREFRCCFCHDAFHHRAAVIPSAVAVPTTLVTTSAIVIHSAVETLCSGMVITSPGSTIDTRVNFGVLPRGPSPGAGSALRGRVRPPARSM